ncbi:MAG: acetyl-CoA acetyltransferase, partial [Acidimicrobiales bacterium]
GEPRYNGDSALAPDPAVGDDLPGVGPAESAIGLMAPVHVYPMFESVVAARTGHTAEQHRQAIGELFAPFSRVASTHPYAWFPVAYTPDEIATPTPDNRIVCEPYTKRMTAFLGSDQGAALVVCSLAAARRAGVADRAVFIWSGSSAVDVRFPASRPDPGSSPAIAAAGRALFEPADLGIDDVEVLDIYSCFPSAVALATDALGLRGDDARGLTSTGGLPYFGGPGNNYTTHGIAAVTSRLRRTDSGSDSGSGPGADSAGGGPRLGLATGLGWFVTKHALGLYGSSPPPGGFHLGDTSEDQRRIDASAAEMALQVPEPTPATVVALTVIRDHLGTATGAPVIARLPDGRQLAAAPADDEVTSEIGRRDTPGMVGTPI